MHNYISQTIIFPQAV